MLIVKQINKEPDGSYTAKWALTPEQMAYLLTYAINNLVVAGVADIEIEAVTSQQQLELEFLQATAPEDLGTVQ